MKLPIRNRTDKPFTLFIEPYCDDYDVPPGAEAIIVLGDNPRHPHSIDVLDGQLSVWSEGGGRPSVEIILKEEQSIIDSLQLARTWLRKLGAKADFWRKIRRRRRAVTCFQHGRVRSPWPHPTVQAA